MKEINYLHVSGLAVVSLIVASIAQHVFKEPHIRTIESSQSPVMVEHQLSEAAKVTAEAETRRISAIRDRGLQSEQARQSQKKAELTKDQAWNRYYKPPTACHSPETSALFNACADEHIKARNRFEAEYKATSAQTIEPFQSTIASNE